MRTLILMRHAKSDWDNAQLSDHSRPLNDRGRRDAPRMAQWIAHQGLIPEIILASTAIRVRETVDALRDGWSDPPPAYFSDALYLTSPEGILRCVQSDAMDRERVMVVAHNPGLGAVVQTLADQPLSMPTAAVAVFRFEIDDWTRLSTGSPAELIGYSHPKALGE